jgi:hypothetical protein
VPPSLLKRSPFLLKKNLESFPSTTRKYAQSNSKLTYIGQFVIDVQGNQRRNLVRLHLTWGKGNVNKGEARTLIPDILG